MKPFAIMIALNTCSSAMTLVGVSLVLGSVMGTRIALTVQMKMIKFAVSIAFYHFIYSIYKWYISVQKKANKLLHFF